MLFNNRKRGPRLRGDDGPFSPGGSSRGFTLAEVIVLIVVVGVALVGVLLVFQNTVAGSADPQVRKQALALAEGLLDEVLLASYDPIAPVGGPTRGDFNDVFDYNGYTTGGGGMRDIEGNLIPGLGNYNARVDVSGEVGLSDNGGTPLTANRARRVTVTVTVTGQADFTITLDGWRIGYAP